MGSASSRGTTTCFFQPDTFSFCSSQVSLRKRINDSSSCYSEMETRHYGEPLHGTHGSAQPEIFTGPIHGKH